MRNNSSNNEKRERAFAKLGEFDYEEKEKVVIPDALVKTAPIFHDGRQYGCKIPTDILATYWMSGDSLKFTRIKNPEGSSKIQIEYVRGKK